MNLETQIRQVRGRLSSPSRLDPNDNRITDLEIVDWIHKAEIQVLKGMVEREKVTQKTTFTAVAGELQGGATGFPDGIIDITRVVHAGVDCDRIPLKELGAIAENTLYEPEAGVQQYFYEISRAGGQVDIGILPAPSTGQVDLYYVGAPARRYKHHRGTTTSAGADATKLNDTSLVQVNDYWNGTEVRLIDGAYSGSERTVSDFVQTGGVVTAASGFDDIIPVGVLFDMGEVSQLPVDYEDLVIVWATYLGLLKDKEINMAQGTRDEYFACLQAVNERYGYTRTEPGREPERAKTL